MRKATGLVWLFAVAGCAPMAAPMPFSTLQRADALGPGGRSVTFAAGAGTGGIGGSESAYGGAMQGRATIENFEVEADGQVVAYNCSGCVQGYQDKHVAVSGRVGIKKTVTDDVAVIAGAGYAGGAGGHALGWDGGVILNLGPMFYLAGRVGMAMPIDNSGEIADVPTTTYEEGTLGVRTTGALAFVGEIGLAGLQAGLQSGGAIPFSVGVDMR